MTERRDWEYAGGADVPVTSEPRDEEAPGVPARGRRHRGDHADRGRRNAETRAVEVAEPQLSPETNARLTQEVRDVVGTDRVEVPRERPHPSRGEGVPRRGILAYLGVQRPMVLGSFAGALVVGAIIALITRTWWVLPLAAGVHALATMTIVAIIIRMTTTIEHPSPELAATLSAEGIRNPDELFSRLIDEFSPENRADRADIASPANERDVEADAAPGRATVEQSTALSPNAGPSRPARGGGAPDWIIWTVAVALFGVSIAIPATLGGGAMWYLTAVMVPLLAGWVLFQHQLAANGGDVRVRGRKPVAVIVVCTAAAVAVFCAVVALAFSH
jgi:hypothetical protein